MKRAIIITAFLFSGQVYGQHDTVSAAGPVIVQGNTAVSYPGGEDAWRNYLQSSPRYTKALRNAYKKSIPAGTYGVVVEIAVDTSGKVTSVRPITKMGFGLEESVIELVRFGGDWIPARRDGVVINSSIRQKVSFIIN